MARFDITPINHGPGKKAKFGAVVTGVDVNNLTDDEVRELREATWRHKLLIIKGQAEMEPIKHWELVCRLDPDAEANTPDRFLEDFHPGKKGLLARIGVTGIPGAENVHLIGKGYQGDDHYGIKGKTIDISYATDMYGVPLPDEEFRAGFTRFQGWHLDAPWYGREPPLFTALRVCRLPRGPDMTIRWDDGSGHEIKAAPGATPFLCCSQLYEELLSDEERRLVDHSWVQYQALPFEWISGCKTYPDGLGHMSQGGEMSDEELAEIGADAAKQKTYPMVWVQPLTGRRSFVAHPSACRRLFLRRGPDEEPVVVDDVAEVRGFIRGILKRALRPEYVVVPPEEDGDLMLWDNCSMLHTRVDYPLELYGPKTCHQAGTNASKGPVGPVPMMKGFGTEGKRASTTSTTMTTTKSVDDAMLSPAVGVAIKGM